MIRLTCLQFRIQAALAALALAAAAVLLAVTGPHLAHVYDTTVAPCAAHGDCPTAKVALLRTDHSLAMWLGYLVVVVPCLVGVFWGAPLIARELETGTHRLAWTQGITRARWLAVKLAVAGLASMVVAGLVSLMVTWWSSPLDRAAADRFGQFDQRGIVPIGYAAFAVALGLAAGIVIRRTLPAMAVTLVGFVAARLADTSWVRPNLLSPAHMNSPLSASNNLGFTAGPTFVTGSPTIPNAMVISSHLAGAAGRTPTRAAVHQLLVKACPGITSPPPPGASGHQHAVAASALGVSALHRPARRPLPPGRHVPAGRSLLDAPVARAGGLPGRGAGPGRAELLVDAAPARLTPTDDFSAAPSSHLEKTGAALARRPPGRRDCAHDDGRDD